MTLTMYQASAPRFVRMLNNLSAILDKAERHCAERKIDPLVLTGARLAPDMLPKTLAFIASVEAAQIDGSEDRDVTLKLAGREMSFTGLDYLFGFAQPNFHFHVVTAYAILRHNGVALGKSDYLGAA